MQNNNLRNYIGIINNAEIIDSTGFDTLSPENVFIKRELTLVFEDGTRAPLANPEYMEFYNNPTGRAKLSESGLDSKLVEAILLIWGDKAILPDPPVPGGTVSNDDGDKKDDSDEEEQE